MVSLVVTWVAGRPRRRKTGVWQMEMRSGWDQAEVQEPQSKLWAQTQPCDWRCGTKEGTRTDVSSGDLDGRGHDHGGRGTGGWR